MDILSNKYIELHQTMSYGKDGVVTLEGKEIPFYCESTFLMMDDNFDEKFENCLNTYSSICPKKIDVDHIVLLNDGNIYYFPKNNNETFIVQEYDDPLHFSQDEFTTPESGIYVNNIKVADLTNEAKFNQQQLEEAAAEKAEQEQAALATAKQTAKKEEQEKEKEKYEAKVNDEIEKLKAENAENSNSSSNNLTDEEYEAKAENNVNEKEEKNKESLARANEIEKQNELKNNLKDEKENSAASEEAKEAIKNQNKKTVNAEAKSKTLVNTPNGINSSLNDKLYLSSSKYFKGSPFESMIFAGADFMKQNFDIGFVFYSLSDQKIITNDWDEVVTMWTRFASIEIPRQKAQTFSIKTPLGNVEKIRSKFEGQRETTLTLRLDKDLQVLDFFNELSYNDERYSNDKYDYYVKYYPASAVYANANLTSKESRIDLVVKHSNSMTPNSSWESKLGINLGVESLKSPSSYIYANNQLPGDLSMLWVFEDINIIGASNGVQFNSEEGAIHVSSIKFTYKRLARVVRD